jgi:protein TonB
MLLIETLNKYSIKIIFAFCFALLGFSNIYSQPAQITSDPDKVYTIVQTKPEFPGNINKYLADNIVYPNDAKANNIQGTVYVTFVVEKDGSVSGVKVLRGVATSLDNESVRVVSAMPKWMPGMQNGHAVRVQYMVPIHFMLSDDKAKKN